VYETKLLKSTDLIILNELEGIRQVAVVACSSWHPNSCLQWLRKISGDSFGRSSNPATRNLCTLIDPHILEEWSSAVELLW